MGEGILRMSRDWRADRQPYLQAGNAAWPGLAADDGACSQQPARRGVYNPDTIHPMADYCATATYSILLISLGQAASRSQPTTLRS